MKIFVQIASYRDPELIPTIKDCLEKAKHPENLTFGICWQHDETEDLSEYENDSRFTILDYHWKKSKGLCWARSLIQKLHNGEEYTLQLDSHHRFAENWDEELINMMELTGSPKPILTSYAGVYSPPNKLDNGAPFRMVADKFTSEGTILFRPWILEGYKELDKPVPARFVSGHYFFTIGKHCEDYKYDPNLYFAGDEISLSIRSYTLGYDLFHPHKNLIWHEYTREGRTKHWTDHDRTEKEKGEIDLTWRERDLISKRRLRQLLGEENSGVDLGEYRLGEERSHHDYELYTGIDFKNKILHTRATKGKTPEIISEKEWWEETSNRIIEKNAIKEWHVNAKWDIKRIPNDDYQFWYFGIEDRNEKVLFRKDFTPDSDPFILNKKINNFTVTIQGPKKPHKWILWPYSKSKEWTGKIEGLIDR